VNGQNRAPDVSRLVNGYALFARWHVLDRSDGRDSILSVDAPLMYRLSEDVPATHRICVAMPRRKYVVPKPGERCHS
jgi:hypothetical protein